MAEETNWDYKPNEPKNASKKSSTRIISWTASEYIEHQRGASWYPLLVIGTLLIDGLVYELTKDKFATGLVLVVGIVVGSAARWKPKQVEYQISSQGLQAGEKFYNYNEFKSFSIIHEGQLSSLVFHPLKKVKLPISVFFDEDDEERISKMVGEHLPLEDSTTDRIDRLSRRLRF